MGITATLVNIVVNQILGAKLPSNLKFIAAANPYRMKKMLRAERNNEAGLSYERHHVLAAMELKTHKGIAYLHPRY